MIRSMPPSRLALLSAALLVIGILLAAIGTSTVLDAAGVAVGGIGGVGLVAAAFYAVGEGEDRQREKDEAARRGPGG
jgi:1,4-dihydroxy-2-naphthoate octaprenyltransferase